MPIFVHGVDIDCTFSTVSGRIDAVASVEISGSTLTLVDPAVYSGDGTRIAPGVRTVLEIARHIEELAKLQGFTRLRVTGTRLTGITPGRPVLLERVIRP